MHARHGCQHFCHWKATQETTQRYLSILQAVALSMQLVSCVLSSIDLTVLVAFGREPIVKKSTDDRPRGCALAQGACHFHLSTERKRPYIIS